MNKRTVKTTMVALMLIAVALYFVCGTYARYVDDFSGTTTVNVANWKVSLDKENLETVTFNAEDNEDVVENKIAPSVKAVAEASLDLTGTEVSVEVIVEKGEGFDEALNTLGLDPEQVTFAVEKLSDAGKTTLQGNITGDGSKSSPFIVKLQDKQALDGKLGIALSIEWNNLDDDGHNTKDTAVGKDAANKTFKLPVTLKVQQHIEG